MFTTIQSAKDSFHLLQSQPSTGRIIIVGAGIVGSALASFLSETAFPIIVLESSLDHLTGSTGHAPGFVGQLNTDLILTRLAQASVEAYRKIPNGFHTVGGLEVATTDEEIELLQLRRRLAREYDLRAEMISGQSAAEKAPDFVNLASAKAALYSPDDGVASAGVITDWYRDQAKANGALFLEAVVSGAEIDPRSKRLSALQTNLGPISAQQVIFATGIWTSNLLSSAISLSVVPVYHPYIHGPSRPVRKQPPPFVRFASSHSYIRDHGTFDGMGSYNHRPIPVDNPGKTAIGPWPDASSDATGMVEALESGYRLLPDPEMVKDGQAFNGLYALTPDNRPLAGKVRGVDGLWVCASIWVTHAAAVAEVVASMVTREMNVSVGIRRGGAREEGNDAKESLTSRQNEEVRRALDPGRFDEQSAEELRAMSLRWYGGVGAH